MEQKIVVHLRDGTIHKGVTQNFDPDGEAFHFLRGEGGGVPMRLRLEDVKALFWVRDYIGNRHFVARRAFDDARRGSRAVVVFEDGEEIWGIVEEGEDGSTGEGPGFFFIPADREDNNLRIFVVRSAMKELRLESCFERGGPR